jgi:serpin B
MRRPQKGGWKVSPGRLNIGERIAGISAILLFILTFFHWFGVKAVNTSNLLFAIQSVEPGKNAWEALEYIPFVLIITIIVALVVAALRLIDAAPKPPVSVHALIAMLGFVSMSLILCRIVDPPTFSVEKTIMFEGTVQPPIVLALLAATGIALGGCLAMREEGVSLRKARRASVAASSALVLVLGAGIGVLGLATPSQAKTLRPLSPAVATGGFGLDLMRAQGPGNLVLSPDSIAAALAMTGTGGVGRTAEEIARTLHLKGPAAFAAVGDLQRAIAARQAAAAVGDPEPPTLEIANGLFLQEGLPFAPAFLSGAQQRFDAIPETVDFEGDPTGALDAINGWVGERTKGLIPRILDSLPPEMALALANAVYLDADWQHPFKKSDTRSGVFHTAAGEVTVDFMHQIGSLRYGAGPGYKAVALPYHSSTLSLLVMLPVRQKLGALQHRLDGRGLARIADSLAPREVVLSLPRFHLNTDTDLTAVLKRLGMPTAFSEAANFSRITTAVPLKVAFVKHAADFTVDEEGTVAAAATVGGVTKKSAGPPHSRDAVIFNANRPFLFFLRDVRSGAVLFAGRLTDPAPEGA